MAAHKNIHAGHRKRLRDRYIREGLDNFHSHEVIELLLCEYLPRINTNDIAHNLVDRFGNVNGVLTASYDELLKIKRIGPQTAEGIMSVRSFMSSQICQHFGGTEPITNYDIAFMADWFMPSGANISLGIIMCDHLMNFRGFANIAENHPVELYEIGDRIVKTCKTPAYFLLSKNRYDINRDNALILREYTSAKHCYMLETCLIDGYTPIPLIHSYT